MEKTQKIALPTPLEEGLRRNKAVYRIARFIGWPLCLTKFKRVPYTPVNEPFLMLSNHNSDGDQFYWGASSSKYLRFVASEHIFNKGFISRALVWLVNPIPRSKGAGADDTVAMMKETLADGVNVCMSAEGNRSFNGETGFISPRVVDIVRATGCAVLTFRFEGGYLRTPRWAEHKRSGRTVGRVVNEYSARQLAAMSDEEVFEAIKNDLYVNAFEIQRKAPRRYRGKKLAEHVEYALYICPKCKKVSALHSEGDFLRCECGYSLRYGEYGFFEGEEVIFDNVLDWDRWQRAYITEHADEFRAQTSEPIFSDQSQELYVMEKGSRRPAGCGTLSLYGDRMEFVCGGRTEIWKFSDITAMAVAKKDRIFFTSGGVYREIRSGAVRSGVKYLAFYRILSGKKYL